MVVNGEWSAARSVRIAAMAWTATNSPESVSVRPASPDSNAINVSLLLSINFTLLIIQQKPAQVSK